MSLPLTRNIVLALKGELPIQAEELALSNGDYAIAELNRLKFLETFLKDLQPVNQYIN